ncbi:hypothetical protein K491DRAFT_597767 [Lophiostoma macrostomum CBS 122681]|uniref:F-box domain-containing protein n=1 Tax=Lophiostoma macrostomum CBS 122681 TaxID=1314788 RepID=A0A6A6T9Q9_9PLEO|nr:hypothetical protein K491DRAFT_597767 [Lophiostoma macrostomum CBS 122681]
MAPRAKQTQAARNRESSPELGSPTAKTPVNKKTGRPIRRTAGQKKDRDGYVDSVVIEEEDDPIDVPSEDEDGRVVKPQRSKKRKRSPSPTPPPMEPIIYEESANESSDDEAPTKFRRSVAEEPITLQFNIPLGFHGPLVVKLDRSLLTGADAPPVLMHPLQVGQKADSPPPAPRKSGTTIADLPAELRNKIYRALFVTDSKLDFNDPSNFCRSAQFLYCSRLIHSEGCSVLYGENTFHFDRNKATRRPFYGQLKEIGYKDVRLFLKTIGPENLAYLRDIEFTFDDASPGATPDLSHEGRRYINDEHLKDCLRIFRGAKLRKISLDFQGRRSLQKTDTKFLSYLEQIKVDQVIAKEWKKWSYMSKINASVFTELKDVMVRRKKLYVEKV